MLNLDPKTSALILIDLQKGIVARETAPYATTEVITEGKRLARLFRAAHAPVVLVHVGFSEDFGDIPAQNVDQPSGPALKQANGDFVAFVDGLEQPGDLVVTKRQWGAFHGTDLDLQLRRRGVRTVVIGGVATNIGVESTVRAAWEHHYDVVVVENACTTFTAEMQTFAFKYIFPRIARVAAGNDVTLAKT